MSMSRIAGPAVAGLLISIPFIGSGGVFLLMGAMYAIAVTALLWVPPAVALGGARPVTLSTVARVGFAPSEEQAISRVNGEPAVTVDVADESATTAHVRAAVEPSGADPLVKVAFAASVNSGPWTYVGTAPGPDHRIAYDLDGLPGGATVEFKAVTVDRDGRSASAKAATTVATPAQSGGSLEWANVHFDGDTDRWGLYVWGDVADESATSWPNSNPFIGATSYGGFVPIRLADNASEIGYLVIDDTGNKHHEADRAFDPSVTPEIWLKTGSGAVAHSLAEARGHVVVRYPNQDTSWGLHLWGDALADGAGTGWDTPRPPDGTDEWGLYWEVPVDDVDAELGVIVHRGDEKAHPDDLLIRPSQTGELWVNADGGHATRAAAEGKAVLRYHRPDGDYSGWTLHVWEGAANPTGWDSGLQPAGSDSFGLVFEVDLADGATALSYIVHRGDEKDLPADQRLDFAEYGQEVWIKAATPGYVRPAGASAARGQDLDLTKERAHWIDANTVALPRTATDGKVFELLSSADGSITVEDGELTGSYDSIRLSPAGGLTEAQRRAFPHLWNYSAFTVASGTNVKEALQTQLVAVERDHTGQAWTATGVQIPGVLDDVYAAAVDADLGLTWKNKNKFRLAVWAPTARSVQLELYDTPSSTPTLHAMTRDAATGAWSIDGKKQWDRKFYRFAIEVWHPATQQIESYSVTDPYSVSLAADSTHSQIVNLSDKDLKPKGWDSLSKPDAVDPAAAQVWEVHVRDFSIADASIPEELRGTYAAFAESDSVAVGHLEDLADAGLTHVHLLPTFDIATIPETGQAAVDCDLASFAPDSAEQQACVGAVRADDAYNWGYDPWHFNAPEGSYATDPDGTRRILEYRMMVKALNDIGLRVVNDVVYNHTSASGVDEKSVLDRTVPGYYHRLDLDGNVATSTCCPNTAPEHAMFGKFVVESIELWAAAYKVDGFRFDLMGHHPKDNLLAVREALDTIDPSVIVYGEGWNFGEVADDVRFEQATQKNMAGTGIGTFNDRMRDAVRGGGPFDADPRRQGFGSGLWTEDNGSGANPADAESALLHAGDLVKIGLVGNLADYAFVASDGTLKTGSELDYNGAAAGYTAQPGEAVNYVDAHDNEILFDALAYKLDADVDGTDRARMQVLSLATAVLSQGTGFVTAGSELMRSKSLDRDSYDSGDWFNAIRWGCGGAGAVSGQPSAFGPSTNGFGIGLPPAWTSEHHWPYAGPTLRDVEQPSCDDIAMASARYAELLRIASSTCAFSLGDADEVAARVSFPLSGEDETPGVITMVIDLEGLGDAFGTVTVVFNATPEAVEQTVAEAAGSGAALHPVLVESADPAFAEADFDDGTGTFTVPARTVAVFVR
jgi:pullulanase-type alpha-1,6-glucosidase